MASAGDTLTLKGDPEGLTMDVTVNKVLQNARGEDEYTTPERGKRFVAIQVTLKNSGQIVYQDSPENGAVLVDAEGEQYMPSYQRVSGGQPLSTAKIGPGDRRRGYLVFEVPKKAKIATFQFTLNSGFAGETGEWTVT
ncbi:DUF4352 domain-containing protein [Bailinhaonella thermotolerans]|uniref:DUF4352 domain-containing protein n=1 Tax=Bailinhaonella thermotolerans TaxID=1070861 RepID=A0A3A4AQY5_9ACTN|nr:DUF4352 domain-containing protein [Bailinhaonella thermotolerans]RJL32166.1 DUF4352 domain-containing protein [Bailinhaonella thermotolerans]